MSNRQLIASTQRAERNRGLIRTALAALVPGLGLLAYRRAFSPLLMITIAAALLSGPLGGMPPFAFEPRLVVSGTGVPLPVQAAMWVLIYAWSLLGYFQLAHRSQIVSAAPARSRASQASARSATSAAA